MRASRQGFAQLLEGRGRIEGEERHGRLGPDHEIDALGTILNSGGISGRQREVQIEDPPLVLGLPLFALGHAWLDQSDTRSLGRCGLDCRELPVAIGHEGGDGPD